MDEHLRTIEVGLSVKISHSHEKFRIDGHKAKVTRALEVLQALYERAAKPVPKEQVQLMLVGDEHMADVSDGSLMLATRRNDVKARTPTQALYLENIAQHDITFGIGPAGTGKTYLAVACAVDALERSAVQRIILTRPAVEAGEKLGFLPGDLGQKVDPYLRPLYDALYELMGFDKVQKAFERSALEIAPLAFMRGRTLNNAFIILDEAQNTTPEQMKMFLTRIGFGAKAVITGDVSQIDLPKGSPSGLVDAEHVLRRVPGIAITHFTQTVTLVIVIPTVIVLGAVFEPAIEITPVTIFAFIPALALAAVLRFLVEYILAMVAFWTTRVSAINDLYYVPLFFFSGQLVPLSLLPDTVRLIGLALPFRWMLSFPVEVVLGRVQPDDLITGYVAQIGWIVIALASRVVIWRAGLRRYAAVGA